MKSVHEAVQLGGCKEKQHFTGVYAPKRRWAYLKFLSIPENEALRLRVCSSFVVSQTAFRSSVSSDGCACIE